MKRIITITTVLAFALMLIPSAHASVCNQSDFLNKATARIGVAKSNNIISLQNAINAIAKTSLKADWIFGRGTKAAVMKFQELTGLFPDGVVGKNTYKVLRERCGNASDTNTVTDSKYTHKVKKFKNKAEFNDFINKNKASTQKMYRGGIDMMAVGSAAPMLANSDSMEESGSSDFSKTNIQEAGVDEADIIKTDGKYIYAVSDQEIVVTDVRESDMKIVSRVDYSGTAQEMYLDGNTLVVIGRDYERGAAKQTSGISTKIWYPQVSYTSVSFYDLSNKLKPRLKKNYKMEGSYVNSRLTGGELYVINNKYMNDTIMPMLKEDGRTMSPLFDVTYFDMPYNNTRMTQVHGINVKNPNEIDSAHYLLSGNQNLYVSQDNIYISYQDYFHGPIFFMDDFVEEDLAEFREPKEETVIHRIAIAMGESKLEASGTVPGRVLNQFSMSEYDGNLRVATTLGNNWNGGASTNNMYVLDDGLKVIGKVEGLAPGERIYSARFMGDKGYMVTFMQTDPLFVIDLSNPRKPKVEGELKIPGFSNYLHPYDEDTLLGIGRDVDVDENGRVLNQGVKIALFDVSNVNNPKEIDSYVLGDRSSSSEALHNHKAVLFSKEKNLLAIPYRYNNHNEKANNFNGAAVFSVDKKFGIRLKGKVSHQTIADTYQWNKNIKRTLYISDILYSLSNRFLQSNSLESLKKIDQVRLSNRKVNIDYPLPEIDIAF